MTCDVRQRLQSTTCFLTNAPADCDAGISCTTSFNAEDETDDDETMESEERVRVRGK